MRTVHELCRSLNGVLTVITQSPSILQLLPGENQPLLIRRDSFLVLDLGLDVIDRVGRFHLESDGFAGEGLDEDL